MQPVIQSVSQSVSHRRISPLNPHPCYISTASDVTAHSFVFDLQTPAQSGAIAKLSRRLIGIHFKNINSPQRISLAITKKTRRAFGTAPRQYWKFALDSWSPRILHRNSSTTVFLYGRETYFYICGRCDYDSIIIRVRFVTQSNWIKSNRVESNLSRICNHCITIQSSLSQSFSATEIYYRANEFGQFDEIYGAIWPYITAHARKQRFISLRQCHSSCPIS